MQKFSLAHAVPVHHALTGTALAVALAFAAVPSAPQAKIYLDVPGADGSVYAQLVIYEPGETLDDSSSAIRTFTADELAAVKKGFIYWSDVLGPSAATPSVTLAFLSGRNDNAAAGSSRTETEEGAMTQLEACLLGVASCKGNGEDGIIMINEPTTEESWSWLELNPLPSNGLHGDLVGTLVHELGHAYGIISMHTIDLEDEETFVLQENEYSIWTSHLRDIYGKTAVAGMTIEGLSADDAVDPSKNDATKFQYYTSDADSGIKFTGENVSDALRGNYEGAPESADNVVIWYSDTTFVDETGTLAEPSVLNSVTGGIPINGVETGTLDLSHLELQNSAMSHQYYRNWQIFMEVELALLQDLGYEFDRKRFFGTSVYETGNDSITITQAFGARENGEWLGGTASTQSWAVGVHVYGSLNTIAVAADQLADGAESFGIRVDGLGNSITVRDGVTISANGENGTGIGFTYGRGHSLTLEAGSAVSASGTNGKALSFDFGSNELGDHFDYRGSWIRSRRSDGAWVARDLPDALEGALMESVIIAGTVSAPEGAAVYISENALVSRINIASGAVIEGDIISNWNALSTEAEDGTLFAESPLYEGVYARAPAGTDLTTDIVFGDAADFAFSYSGDITGANGIRLTFSEGTTAYSGTATVLGVVLGPEATLKGAGAYRLTAAPDSETEARARVSADTGFRQGTFVNYGVLYSSGATGNVTIEGDYVQAADSTLVVGLRSTGTINPLKVTGDAMTSNDADTESEVLAAATSNLTLLFVPEESYFASGAVLTAADAGGLVVEDGDSGISTEVFTSQAFLEDPDLLDAISTTLDFAVADGGATLTASRAPNAYTKALAAGNPSASATERSAASILDAGAGDTTDSRAQALVAAIDFTPDSGTVAGMIGELTGDALLSSVRAQFALERLIDRSLARRPADAAVSGRHVWAQPFGGRLADNTAGAHSRTKAAGVAGGVTVTEPGQEIGWQVAAAYFSEKNNLHAKTRGQGLWLGASVANAFDAADTWWFDLSGRIGFTNVETERVQPLLGSSQEVKGTRWSASLSGKAGPRIELADVLFVRPSVGLTGTVLRTPSKTEGNVGGLAIDDAWYRSLRAQIGVAAGTAPIASAVTGFSWKWTANAGYERELLSDAGEFTAGIAGMAGTFSQRVGWNDRNRWLIGGGLELVNDKGFSAAVRLEGELTHGDGAAVTGGAELRWRF
ncbi:autotransporter outer membrane beta-barrel domain-containing protein [Sutterella sp.]|uniref:autotransporter family protein n=1 Tax=Sutterella sp. TaxID=1981025 RepID=UPI0026E05805|nr:autotransporter outer membrane beta-barrel domain-containing protein [Sutterella sp.]MDO5532836.1 autotransporter outer membrane beta-barrel domain-containing protein [Sutterella sp.]